MSFAASPKSGKALIPWVIDAVNLDLLAFSGYPSVSKIISSVALTFSAYLGFNVITFAAGDLRDPARELPRAMFGALSVTTLVYVLIALGVFGTLTVVAVIGYGETAIAEAARPALGDAGFSVMAVAALLSTAGATNATLYASSNLTGMLAQEELFPLLLRGRLASRRESRPPDHRRPRPPRRQPRRPICDRLGPERGRADDLRARRPRRLAPPRRHGQQYCDRRTRDRSDCDRPRLLRRRHLAQRSPNLHCDRRHPDGRRTPRSLDPQHGSPRHCYAARRIGGTQLIGINRARWRLLTGPGSQQMRRVMLSIASRTDSARRP